MHAGLRMLELDLYHLHKLGHTSCHAVDCIFLARCLESFQWAWLIHQACVKENMLVTSQTEVTVQVVDSIPRISHFFFFISY